MCITLYIEVQNFHLYSSLMSMPDATVAGKKLPEMLRGRTRPEGVPSLVWVTPGSDYIHMIVYTK